MACHRCRAKSSAGIAALKHRNRLQGILIIETLLCLNCTTYRNMIIQSDTAVSIVDDVAEKTDIPIDVGGSMAH